MDLTDIKPTIKLIKAPILYDDGLLKYKNFTLDSTWGVRVKDTGSDYISVYELHECPYSDVNIGDIFLPLDYEIEDFMQIGLYTMKMKSGNLYLTGDNEHPISVDMNTYDVVWKLKEYTP